MNRKEEIISAFYNNGFKMRLGDILKFPWGYKFTSRASELRREGYTIICEKADKPSDNLYRMTPPEDGGQTRFV